ncbi:GntR family transcriptional regulator [Sediminispirochaeta smaragdinae]|nr:GntR family transcriptional regulator [Sediminispirochaeta smaragdinae]
MGKNRSDDMSYGAGKVADRWKVDSVPLYVKVKERIIEMIEDGEFVGNRLPPENMLSERLSVSRASIREALAALSREGIVSKRHGIGNLIHRSTLRSRMRIDRYVDFSEILRDAGHRVRFERTAYHWLPGEETLCIEACYIADEKPAIMVKVLVPSEMLASDPLKDDCLYNTLPDFLNTYACEPVSHSLCYFKPAAASDATSRQLDVPPGAPILEWKESFYSIFDKILAKTTIHFNPEIVSFSLLRKWE